MEKVTSSEMSGWSQNSHLQQDQVPTGLSHCQGEPCTKESSWTTASQVDLTFHNDLTVSTRCHRLTTLRAPACEPASCCRTMSICTKRQLSYTYLKLSQSKLIKCKNVRNIKENYTQLYDIVVPYHIIVLQSSMQFHDVRYSTDRMWAFHMRPSRSKKAIRVAHSVPMRSKAKRFGTK